MPSNHNFEAILEEIASLQRKKNMDYGRETDPYANIRGSVDWGIPAWQGAMIRANDKLKRLQKFAQTGELENESVEDSFKDLAVYALIALDLFRQDQTKPKANELSQWQLGNATQNDMEDAVVAATARSGMGHERTMVWDYDKHRVVQVDPGDETRHIARND